MTAHFYVSPAGSGKTSYAIAKAREAARGLRSTPLVCVSSQLQVSAWHRRLAEEGGAIGVRVMTFGDLYRACLDEQRVLLTEISEPEQHHLLSDTLRRVPLQQYAPLVHKPGFVQILQGLGIKAISLDSIMDDSNLRLVENMRATLSRGAAR